MRVTGSGSFEELEPSHRGSHRPGPQEQWQESVVVLWWDPASAVGGYFRLGHEVNLASGPMVATWSTIFSPYGIYKCDSYLPLPAQERTALRMGNGDRTIRYEAEEGGSRWTIEHADISGTLRVEDFHVQFDGWPKSGKMLEFNPHHIDMACRVTGRLRIKGRDVEVSTLGFRDHAWGQRDWNALLSHRWCVGAFGPDLSFFALSIHTVDDVMLKFGWAVNNDQLLFAEKIDIVAFLESDGMTNRGGALSLQLPEGETLDIAFKPAVPSALYAYRGVVNCDTLCTVHGQGRTGIGCFESTNNALQGRRVPSSAIGLLQNGWHSVG
jgi:hypothetical protein